jgi:hypothetical protein
MQERPKAIIAGFGCQPPSPDYPRLLSADITEGGPKRSLGTEALSRGTGSSNPSPSSEESGANLTFDANWLPVDHEAKLTCVLSVGQGAAVQISTICPTLSQHPCRCPE